MRRVLVAGAVFMLFGAVACDNASDVASTTTAPLSGVIDEARCAANREAGTITYLTGFDFAASAGMLDVVVAEENGYFDDVCLDVELVAGATGTNVTALAADEAQFASLGSLSEVASANNAEADLVAVVQYGHEPIDELLVPADSTAQSVADLAGSTVGFKGGSLPFSIKALLADQGVSEDSLTLVAVGFDPEELYSGRIDALPGYKSNERHRLDAAGRAYRSFDPADFDVPGSFGIIVTSMSFAAEHPSAVADFVRASLRGFNEAVANPDAAIAQTLARSDAAFFFTAETEFLRWQTESGLALVARDAGVPLGSIDLEAAQGEVDFLATLGVIDEVTDIGTIVDPSFVESVTDASGVVIWK